MKPPNMKHREPIFLLLNFRHPEFPAGVEIECSSEVHLFAKVETPSEVASRSLFLLPRVVLRVAQFIILERVILKTRHQLAEFHLKGESLLT